MGDERVRRVYKAVPETIWVNDAILKDGSYWRDHRIEVSLEELHDLLA
jgi:hypothetical protein